jgi:hypothetical protein
VAGRKARDFAARQSPKPFVCLRVVPGAAENLFNNPDQVIVQFRPDSALINWISP